ncbi:MAG: DUF4424 family protein [Sphingomonadaceae bacterium]
MTKTPARLMMAASLCLYCPLASANDTESAIGLGGLVLLQNDTISMDSEELFISQDKIRVTYHFTNPSSEDVTVLVSFPLPASNAETEWLDGPTGPADWKSLEFSTRVDGQDAPLRYTENIMLNGQEISARLTELGWPKDVWEEDAMQAIISTFSPEERQAYIAEGLLKQVSDASDILVPAWSVEGFISREQVFPAGKTVLVEHSYTPLNGGSVGGNLNASMRTEEYGWKEYRDAYCINESFLRGFDKKQAQAGESRNSYLELWIDYVLSSGANWKGPIKDFRLVVDKGSPENMTSFCMDGVKKISPTQFEVRKTNYEPGHDLQVLIVQWPQAEG